MPSNTDKTIKAIAEELGTNKAVIYRIIQKLGLNESEHSRTLANDAPNTKANTAKYYDETAQEAIKTEYLRRGERVPSNSEPNTREHLTEHPENARERSAEHQANTELIKTLREQIEALQSEIEHLRANNDKQAETITELTALLSREQELRAHNLMIESKAKQGFFARLLSRTKRESNDQPR